MHFRLSWWFFLLLKFKQKSVSSHDYNSYRYYIPLICSCRHQFFRGCLIKMIFLTVSQHNPFVEEVAKVNLITPDFGMNHTLLLTGPFLSSFIQFLLFILMSLMVSYKYINHIYPPPPPPPFFWYKISQILNRILKAIKVSIRI